MGIDSKGNKEKIEGEDVTKMENKENKKEEEEMKRCVEKGIKAMKKREENKKRGGSWHKL